ncbi:MAG: ABC transporter permease [Angelakisella sp.]
MAKALLLFLLLLCFAMSIGWQETLQDNGSVTLYLPEGKNSYDILYASEQRTTAPVAFTMWQQQEGQVIENRELNRTKRASVMTLCGDSTLALPSLPMLLPSSGRGCLVDAQTCYDLFGDLSPVGGTILLNGQSYIIIGVFEWPTAMVVRQGTSNSGETYDRITLGLPGTANKAQAADEFAMRHGLSPIAVVSMGQWTAVAGFFVRLFPLVMLIWLLFASFCFIYRKRETPVIAGLLVCGTAVATMIFWRVAGLSFSLPVELLPSRWSDFEFWATTFAQLKEQFWVLMLLPKELPQAMPMIAVLHCVAWSILAFFLFVLCKDNKLYTCRELAINAGLSLFLACAVVMMATPSPVEGTPVLFLYPIFLVWKYFWENGQF